MRGDGGLAPAQPAAGVDAPRARQPPPTPPVDYAAHLLGRVGRRPLPADALRSRADEHSVLAPLAGQPNRRPRGCVLSLGRGRPARWHRAGAGAVHGVRMYIQYGL